MSVRNDRAGRIGDRTESCLANHARARVRCCTRKTSRPTRKRPRSESLRAPGQKTLSGSAASRVAFEPRLITPAEVTTSLRGGGVIEDPNHVWIKSTWKETDPRLPLIR